MDFSLIFILDKINMICRIILISDFRMKSEIYNPLRGKIDIKFRSTVSIHYVLMDHGSDKFYIVFAKFPPAGGCCL